ncbi:MAG: imidazole glycerol phosphate synthase subunit HisF [Flavobacteriales bacterium]|nr:imidazole glycerol phosphate synthase subunit HisF [Flavobacteriales bacterium]
MTRKLPKRVMPCLLVSDGALVKTVRFKKANYIGDAINTVRIFNEKEVDELVVLDIDASVQQKPIDLQFIREVATECFMPVAYGGGIKHIDQVKTILESGIEKVVINASAIDHPELISEIAASYGSQSLIVSIDVKKNLFGKQEVVTDNAKRKTKRDPVAWAKEVEQRGAGEILITSVDQEGTWEGYDVDLIRRIADAVNIPVIAHGGAGSILDMEQAFKEGHASAFAAGSMFVYQKKGFGVLINFPSKEQIEEKLT